MDKDQWWAHLKRLADKYGQDCAPVTSAVLAVGFETDTVMSVTVSDMITALNTLNGAEQSAKIKEVYLKLSTDREMLPYVVSLLAISCEPVIKHLCEMSQLGVSDQALINLARKTMKESTDPQTVKALVYLKKIGKRLKLKSDDVTEPEKSSVDKKPVAEQEILQGPRSPKVEQMLAAQKAKTPEAKNVSKSESSVEDQGSNFAQPGDIVGGQDWVLLDLLGRGGMGSVWRAKNHFEELGALKLMLPHLVSNDRLIQRFQLEIRAIKKIRHPNVVELSDWGRDRLNGRDRWYFVTDFIAGKPLSRILKERKSLGLEELKEMFIQIALGLHAAHAEGVIHRDIKPGNIMIRSDGSPVIIDFGIARQLENPSMTQTHERVLTLQFASPEQLYGEPVGPQSDVFSLAATLGFCFSPDPKRQRPQFEPDKVPEAFHYALEKSLSYKQENRPQDMQEFADLLRQIEFNNGVIVNFPRGEQDVSKVSTPGLSEDNAFVPGQTPPPQAHALRLKSPGGPELSPELAAIRDEVFHYHGPDGQQKLPLHQIVELIKANPRGRHLVWRKGWNEWKPWFKLKLLKDYVQALKESKTSHSESSALTPFSKHTIEVKGIGHSFIALPQGSFWMGNQNVDAEADEKPRHRVTLTQGFIISETQITQDLFEAVSGHNPSQYKQLAHPVERVSWLDAIRWCNQLSENQSLKPAYTVMNGGDTEAPKILWNKLSDGYRLPTEAEWEYAARSGTNFTYSGSNRPDEVAWFGSSRRREGQRTYEVKGKSPNGWGLYDMSGNVWEWCWGDMREYSGEDALDPIGSTDTGYSICRGGSNYLDARQTRCSYRMRYAISYRSLFVGFRIVRSIGV